MKKLILLSAAALSAALVLAGCAKKAPANAAVSGITFTIALDSDIEAVDPGRAWGFTTNQVTNQITEGLVTFDEDNDIVPLLAKSWSQPDELTYVYDVRDNVVFSDGSKMTMDDVLFSFERARDPEGGTWFADFFEDVESFSVQGWQFTIKLKQPNAIFQFVPATGAGRIISKAHYEKTGADNIGTPTGGLIGTGPFAFKSWLGGQEIVLVKNENYWDSAVRETNIIGTLVYKIIPDDTARVIALQNGTVDFSVNIPEDSISQLEADPNLTFRVFTAPRMQTLAFNTQRAPFDDPAVRKAVSHAFDLPAFERNILKSAGTAGTALPFGTALYGENAARWQAYIGSAAHYNYDLDLAKSLFRQSRYPNGFNATLMITEASLASSRALFVQEALKPLGINVEIVKLSGDEHDNYQTGGVLDANGKRDYDMLLGGWEADYPDIYGNLGVLYASGQADGGYNSAAYVNPAVDKLIEAQLRVNDPALRFDIQRQLVDIIIADVPYIPFDYTTRQYALNKKWTGLNLNASWLWTLPFQKVRAN